MTTPFLHQLPDVKELFEITAQEKNVLPILVEKDYWIMHTLWGLIQRNYSWGISKKIFSKPLDMIFRL